MEMTRADYLRYCTQHENIVLAGKIQRSTGAGTPPLPINPILPTIDYEKMVRSFLMEL